jgi:RsiW-degrading membrane proteinase PrsW (M82 family)
MILAAIIVVLVVGAAGIALLYLASQGMLPTAFGLLDMSQDSNRALVVVVLLVIVAVLALLYRRLRTSGSREDMNVDQ